MEKQKEWIRIIVKEEIEVQHGYRTIERIAYRCPRCKWEQRYRSKFCPDCGKDLREYEDA